MKIAENQARVAAALASNPYYTPPRASEELLQEIIKEDLGITVNKTALRIFLRHRWDRISKLAHRIHEGQH